MFWHMNMMKVTCHSTLTWADEKSHATTCYANVPTPISTVIFPYRFSLRPWATRFTSAGPSHSTISLRMCRINNVLIKRHLTRTQLYSFDGRSVVLSPNRTVVPCTLSRSDRGWSVLYLLPGKDRKKACPVYTLEYCNSPNIKRL